jgi:Tfp pilus assembly protein PilN
LRAREGNKLMTQQTINLYKKITSENYFSESPLTWQLFIISNLIIIAGYTLVSLVSFFNIKEMAALHQSKITEIAQLQTEVTKLKSIYPETFFTKDVNTSLKEIQEHIQKDQALLDSLSNHVYFSKALTDLSKVMVNDVWLTDIKFSNNGQLINLTGRSINMNKFNLLIKNILADKAYSDYRLDIDNIDTAKEINTPLTFTITIEKKSP